GEHSPPRARRSGDGVDPAADRGARPPPRPGDHQRRGVRGQESGLAAPHVKVVSLVPSLTETLVVWGVDVVGRTRFCLHGDGERVGGTKDPDVSAVIALRPDLVVANKEENRADDVAALEAAGLDVVVTDIGSLRGAAGELRRLGAL